MGIILRYKDLLSTYKTRGHRISHLVKYKSLFPLRTSPLLAGIIGDLIGDGSLQGDPKWRFDFTSKNVDELSSFNARVKRLFNISGKVRKCNSNKFAESYNLGINNAPVSRILLLAGVPEGQKVLKNFRIPYWVMKNKDCFREFTKQFFSCEASIMSDGKRKIPQIRLENWKVEEVQIKGNKLVEDLVDGLKCHYKINCSVSFPSVKNYRKDGKITRPTRMYLHGENVKKYKNNIGFSNDKILQLEKSIKE